MTDNRDISVDVYYARVGNYLLSDLLNMYFYKLPEWIFRSILRFKNENDRLLSLVGKLLFLKWISEKELDSELSLYNIKTSEYNRPYVEFPIDFNISHSGRICLLAISRQCKVGIDIEEIRDIDFFEFRNIFTPGEWNLLQADLTNYKLFYELWTKKEAVVKANGKGLSNELNKVQASQEKIEIDGEHFFLRKIDLNGNYVSYLATDIETVEIVVREILIQEILESKTN